MGGIGTCLDRKCQCDMCKEYMVFLESENASLRAELEEAGREIKRFSQWVNDLQSGMFINCVYCGHQYGPKDKVPVAMAEVLKRHIEKCPKHPMSKLSAALAKARELIYDLRDRMVKSGGHHPMCTIPCQCGYDNLLLRSRELLSSDGKAGRG